MLIRERGYLSQIELIIDLQSWAVKGRSGGDLGAIRSTSLKGPDKTTNLVVFCTRKSRETCNLVQQFGVLSGPVNEEPLDSSTSAIATKADDPVEVMAIERFDGIMDAHF